MHRWQSQCLAPRLRPDWRPVWHMFAVKSADGLVHDRRKTAHVIGIDVNHVLPARAGGSQCALDILKSPLDLGLDRIGDLQIVVPATLTGYLDALAEFERL